MDTFTDLQKMLPLALRQRLAWVGGFVTDHVAEKEEWLDEGAKLSPQKLRALQIATCIWALDRFLREGTRAAQVAVDEFKRLDVPGFRVGSTVFEGRNENVMLGETLADDLRRSFPLSGLLALMDHSSTVRGAVDAAYREIRRG